MNWWKYTFISRAYSFVKILLFVPSQVCGRIPRHCGADRVGWIQDLRLPKNLRLYGEFVSLVHPWIIHPSLCSSVRPSVPSFSERMNFVFPHRTFPHFLQMCAKPHIHITGQACVHFRRPYDHGPRQTQSGLTDCLADINLNENLKSHSLYIGVI